jgi:hypothetical protein
MSKVVIQGNASGTGNFTIAAPNSNTDRTLTLPDVAGTVLTSGSNADFPAGSVLQVATDTLDGLMSGSYTAGVPSTITNGGEVFSLSFTPKRSNSVLLAQTSSISIHEESNFADTPWLALWDGSTFISANSGTWRYSNFASGFNGAYRTLNESWILTDSNTRTISVRAGFNGGSGTTYINGNSYHAYTGSSGRARLTVWEIAQ